MVTLGESMRTSPAFLAIWLSACVATEEVADTGTESDTAADTDDTDVDTDDTDTEESPSYLTDVYRPFLEESCGGCHVEAGYIHPPITDDPSHLIGTASVDGMVYVSPGSLEDSFLWYKITNRQAEVSEGGTRMPPPPEDALSARAVAAIEAWILGGAAP